MLYSFFKLLGEVIFGFYYRVRRFGLDSLPKEGPLILASNHISYMDPLLIGLTFPRQIIWMMLESIYRRPVINFICRKASVIPVRRNSRDLQALKRAIGVVKRGFVLGVFPEGRMSRDGKLQSAFGEGAAMISLKTGAPILPAAIVGSYHSFPPEGKFPKPGKITVTYGAPLFFSRTEGKLDRKTVVEATERLRRAIERLLYQSRSPQPQWA